MADGYHHLTYGSRCQIYALKKSGLSIRGVARALEVSASTVSRELHRNGGRRGYRMKQAQRFSESRRRFASSRPRKLTEALWGRIEGKLCLQWSPQQIAGRLRLQGGASVGKTWIYPSGLEGSVEWRDAVSEPSAARQEGQPPRPLRRGPRRDSGPGGYCGASGGGGVKAPCGRLGVGHDYWRAASGGAGFDGGPVLEVHVSSWGGAQDVVCGWGRGSGVF